jgi:hypothetical protein
MLTTTQNCCGHIEKGVVLQNYPYILGLSTTNNYNTCIYNVASIVQGSTFQ